MDAIEHIKHKYVDVASGNTVSFEISKEDYFTMLNKIQTLEEVSIKTNQKATKRMDELHVKIQELTEQLSETEQQKFAFQEHVDVITELLKDCNGEKEELVNTILEVINEKDNKTPVQKYETLLIKLEQVATNLVNRKVVTD
ncbi:hypothetical protein P9X10_01000 [Bacillus cereus]|nr:hypothetical protein [Bacillus cereus]